MDTICAIFSWTSNNLIAIATLVTAIATLAIAVFGFRQLIQTHRPRIILRDAWMELDKREILYMLENNGGTKATIVESRIMAEFIVSGQFIRPLRSQGHDDLGRLTFAAGEMKDLTYAIPNEVGFYIRHPDTMRIGIEDKPPMIGDFYFTGAILYSDAAGNKRRSIFRRRWDKDRKGFYRLNDLDQEYAD
jgi:hypothetical protein